MKRTLSILMILAMLLTATACGRVQLPVELPPLPTPTQAPAADTAETVPAQAVQAEATPTPEPAPTPTPEPTPRPLLPVELNESSLDPSIFAPAEEKGELVFQTYETCDYESGLPDRITKTMAVYLPYGYDEEKQYDVLFLLHTSGGDENTWLGYEHAYTIPDQGTLSVSMVNMLDNMIQQGRCAPLIVVGPSCYVYPGAAAAHNSARDFEQFDQEFSQDLLPFVAEHYATYAADGSPEALAQAREHFGILGASFGAYVNYISIFATHLDLAAWYCFVGGGGIDYSYVTERWSARGMMELPIDCLYIVEGEYDDRFGPESSYNTLKTIERFNDQNLRYSIIQGAGHEPRAWVNGLYNSLELFFRDTAGAA